MDNHNGLSARPCQSLYARDGVVEKTTDVCCAMKAVVFPQGIRVAVTPRHRSRTVPRMCSCEKLTALIGGWAAGRSISFQSLAVNGRNLFTRPLELLFGLFLTHAMRLFLCYVLFNSANH